MALADLTDPNAVRAALEEHDAVGADAFLAEHGFRRARTWVLVHDGREYDSKAIAGVAHGYQHPGRGPLRSSDFTGGEQSVVRRLRALGFDVRRRDEIGREPALPQTAFTREDCALFERYPVKVRFREENVSDADRRHFKSIWARLKEVTTWVARQVDVGVPLRAEASLYSQNGYSQTDLWACVYPQAAPNKSYALQAAIIVSATGAELCFCLGAGQSQLAPERRAAAEAELARVKRRLAEAPVSLYGELFANLPQWDLRLRWREPARTRDFSDVRDWAVHAASPAGNGASISYNLTPRQLARTGTDVGPLLATLVRAVGPLLAFVYDAKQGAASPRRATAAAHVAAKLHVDPRFVEETVELLEDKRQVILYGPPGTGKTYVAQRLIEWLAPDPSQHDVVQFHPSYSYEDFVLGYRPYLQDGQLVYRLQPGPLVRLAARAAARPQRRFILLVDEINRGNLPRIFGELLHLLEYRDRRVSLMYAPSGDHALRAVVDADGRFALPGNLWLIGTMNTADRSIGLIDAALRRRFHFVPFYPDRPPLRGLLERWLARQDPQLQPLAQWVDVLNERLRAQLGRHVQLGHSYFIRKGLTLDHVEQVWERDVMPFLEDQLFDQEGALQQLTLAAIQESCASAEAGGEDADADAAPDRA